MFISGFVLFGLAILDRLQWLPTAANSESIADVIPLPFDPWMVQILFAVVGTLLIRGPKYELSEFEENYQRLEHSREKERRVQEMFNEKARSMSASREGLARRSRLLDRDAHLVPFRTRNSPKVRATCPFCKGGGCKECRMSVLCNQIGGIFRPQKRDAPTHNQPIV